MHKNYKITNFVLAFLLSALIILPISASARSEVTVRIDKNLPELLPNNKSTPFKRQQKEKIAKFWLKDTIGEKYEVRGLAAINNLRTILVLAKENKKEVASISIDEIYENPVKSTSRSIKERYWDALTRRVDGDHLAKIFKDSKIKSPSQKNYVYTPYDDEIAYKHFVDAAKKYPDLNIVVKKAPKDITPEYMKSIENKHGILSLHYTIDKNGKFIGTPFVVPGGRFNEMYGWDSYFEALGLLADGRIDLAKGMADNFIYQIEHYGKILNANRTYYLTRSQPPFLTSLILAIHKKSPQSKEWLKRALSAAIKEYNNVWMNKDRLTETGLSRYYGAGLGQPPEVEFGHYDIIYKLYAAKYNMDLEEFKKAYKEGKIKVPELDEFFTHDRSVRESGHDTTYRFGDKLRCADFATVDLNSLLYKTEIDIARISKILGNNTEEITKWRKKSQKRKELILKYLWNDERKMFFDYDFVNKRQSKYISATAFYPLWAKHIDDPSTAILSDDDAKDLVNSLLPHLEMPGGITASAKKSRGEITDNRPQRQWDYPYGWPPHQMIAWQGLFNYSLDEVANRLVYRWLYTITSCAVDYYGAITEKLDVVKRSHEVFAEYGNVGLDFDRIPREGFGWMDASYQVGLDFLSKNLQTNLEKLIPPEWVFSESEDVCKN